jgi:penicillin-binding protein 1A
MGKGNTGGRVAAPIFGSFMTQALADTPPAPFRIPPGIKLVRVDLRTGLRAAADDPNSIMEAFKPGEEPDDAYSVIGLTGNADQGGGSADDDDYYHPEPQQPRPPTFGSGRGGLW